MLNDIRTVGFIGLGEQGEPIAHNLVAAGFDVLAFDVRDEALSSFVRAGGRRAASVADAASEVPVIFICVVNDDQLRQVMEGEEGLLANMLAGGIIVGNSTVSLAIIQELAPRAADAGIELLDAPLTGGGAGAVARRLVYFVGGSASAIDVVEPLLNVSATRIIRVGESGNGIRAKLMHQLILSGNFVAASDGWRLGRSYGLSDDIIKDVIVSGSARSIAAEYYPDRELSDNGRMMIAKDLGLCMSESERLGINLESASIFQEMLMKTSSSSKM